MSRSFTSIVRLFQEIRIKLISSLRLAVIFSVLCCLAITLLGAWVLSGSLGWNQGVYAPLLIDLTMLLLILAGTLAYRWLSNRISQESAILESMETQTGLPPGLLLGSLQLERTIPLGVSHALASCASEKTLSVLNSSNANLSGEKGVQLDLWSKWASRSLVLFGLILSGLTFSQPQRSFMAWSGLFTPIELLAKPNLPGLEISPGSSDVIRGSQVVVTVKAIERDSVSLYRQTVGDVLREETSPVLSTQAVFTLQNLNALTEYWVVASDGTESDRFVLNPIDPLLVADLSLKIDFPEYTGRYSEEYRSQIPDLLIPSGSRISIEGVASRKLESALLVSEKAEEVVMTVNGNTFQGNFHPQRNGAYSWKFYGENGDPAVLFPEPLKITILPDLSPDVEVLLPGKDTILPVSRLQPLVVQSNDDYGIDRLELLVYKASAFGDSSTFVRQPIPIGGTRGALVHPVMDFTDWELLPGDTLHYFVRAIDNAPNPNTGQTREYLLLPQTRAEVQRTAQEQLDAVVEMVDDLQDQIEKESQINQDLETEASRDRSETPLPGNQTNGLGFQDQEKFKEALETQRQILNAIDSLESELSNLTQDIETSELGDVNLEEDLGQLENLMSELVPDQAKDKLEEFLETITEMASNDAKQMFSELVADQEALRERLEEVQSRFERAALDQNFRATAAEAQELSQLQEMLAEAMTDSVDARVRAEQQEKLETRADDLGNSLEELEDQLETAGEMDARDAIARAQERNEKAQGAMEEASTNLRMGKQSSASARAKDAAAELTEMASEMQDAQQEMAGQSMQASVEALRQTATDALAMANEQASLRDEMREQGGRSAQQLRGDELALLVGVEAMADGLGESIPYGTEENRALSSQMGRVMMALQETLESLGAQRGIPSGSPPAVEQVIDALNQLALTAMAAGKEAGQNGQQGSGEQTMEELQQLAEQQGSVNSQTGQLKPMQLGDQTMESQLQELSGLQEEIAEQLSELSNSPEEGSALGDIDELASEALGLAELLAGNRLNAETLRRQERLFQRLLDAGRSLEQDEYSEERESEEPGNVLKIQANELSDRDMGYLPFQIPDSDVMNNLSPAFRQMVLEYFDRINRTVSQRGRTP